MDYKLIFTQDDFVEAMRKKGYDLRDNSVLNSTHFSSQDDAIDEFLQNSFDTIYELIRDNRGNQWTELFMDDMSKDLSADEQALKYKTILKEALVEQALFVWDNGDADAVADNNDERSPYAPKAVKKLWGNILRG